jgi:hypothetical protein
MAGAKRRWPKSRPSLLISARLGRGPRPSALFAPAGALRRAFKRSARAGAAAAALHGWGKAALAKVAPLFADFRSAWPGAAPERPFRASGSAAALHSTMSPCPRPRAAALLLIRAVFPAADTRGRRSGGNPGKLPLPQRGGAGKRRRKPLHDVRRFSDPGVSDRLDPSLSKLNGAPRTARQPPESGRVLGTRGQPAGSGRMSRARNLPGHRARLAEADGPSVVVHSPALPLRRWRGEERPHEATGHPGGIT